MSMARTMDIRIVMTRLSNDYDCTLYGCDCASSNGQKYNSRSTKLWLGLATATAMSITMTMSMAPRSYDYDNEYACTYSSS